MEVKLIDLSLKLMCYSGLWDSSIAIVSCIMASFLGQVKDEMEEYFEGNF